MLSRHLDNECKVQGRGSVGNLCVSSQTMNRMRWLMRVSWWKEKFKVGAPEYSHVQMCRIKRNQGRRLQRNVSEARGKPRLVPWKSSDKTFQGRGMSSTAPMPVMDQVRGGLRWVIGCSRMGGQWPDWRGFKGKMWEDELQAANADKSFYHFFKRSRKTILARGREASVGSKRFVGFFHNTGEILAYL